MQITDYALIFAAIMFPVIIIVYINVSYTIKAGEQELYYEKIINQAVADAALEMKEVENSDGNIDYGYSGNTDKKISVNAQIGVDTFLNSLYNNFGIIGNESAEQYLQLFIPAIAIIDYNGIQVSSIEKYNETISGVSTEVKKHALKPKRYYTYSYSILRDGTILDGMQTSNSMVDSIHTIEFTMDDYITHRGVYKNGTGWIPIYKDQSNTNSTTVQSFYIKDSVNNSVLYRGTVSHGYDVKDKVETLLTEKRAQVIIDTITEEMSYAVSANNSYAAAEGISYNFVFPTITVDEMYETIQEVGMMAFVQGISVGNKYLNTKAYGLSKLNLVHKYYFTVPSVSSKYKMNLYHKSLSCPEYKLATHTNIIPQYVTSKQQAASAKCTLNGSTYMGFYPCQICRP